MQQRPAIGGYKKGHFYTLRGHKAGVTALTSIGDNLISGDEEGSLRFWSMITNKCEHKWDHIADSKIVDLKQIRLANHVVVVQTRDHGLLLVGVDDFTDRMPSMSIVARFPTYESLFSRGDALNLSGEQAVLAYPSCDNNHDIILRHLNANVQVIGDGVAMMVEQMADSNRPSVFDIKLVIHSDRDYVTMFAGYEDGKLMVFKATIAPNNLKIETLKKVDLGLSDFISAFDVRLSKHDDWNIICGSPQKRLVFCKLSSDLKQQSVVEEPLKKPGCSAITFWRGEPLAAIADWSGVLRLFDTQTMKECRVFELHNKQISSIVFVDRVMCAASLDGTISLIGMD